MVVIPRYSSWCDGCDWNIEPHRLEQRLPTQRQKFLSRLGARAGASLQREFMTTEGLRPRLTPMKLGAYALSLFVHLLTLLLAIGGVALLFSGQIFGVVFGILLLGMAWLFRPRFRPMPAGIDPPEHVVAIRGLADRIAAEVGTRPADGIVVTGEFNTAVTTAGWRAQRILFVGLPLFAVLEPQERVAVLAHEFGHFSNGDPRRGFFVGSAVDTLFAWHELLAPNSLLEGDEHGMPGIVMLPINLVMLALSLIPRTLAVALLTMLYRDAQRGEYRADAEAALIAGTDAVVATWDKLHFAELYWTVASSTTTEHWRNQSMWDELRGRVAEVPEREVERARRRDRATDARLDATHPPTHLRSDAVLARPREVATLVLTDDQSAAIDHELRAIEPAMQAEITEAYRDSIHSGASVEEIMETY